MKLRFNILALSVAALIAIPLITVSELRAQSKKDFADSQQSSTDDRSENRAGRPIMIRNECLDHKVSCTDSAGVLRIPHRLRVGSHIDPSHLHIITRPGLYGIGNAPRGSNYGIVDGRLVRFDPQNMQILSVVRMVEAILD